MTAKKDIETTKDSNAVSVESTALFAVLNEWLDVAKREDDLAERAKDNPNGLLARARGSTLRSCAKELSDCILANSQDY